MIQNYHYFFIYPSATWAYCNFIHLWRKAAFEKEFPDFAYELIELQMDVEDETINPDPQIDKISRLLQLYMVRVL